MSTSGTSAYTLDLAELIEEAFERATGGARPMLSGYDYRTARRSLNLLTMDWANRGLNLWTIEQGVIPLAAGVSSYQLPADTVDMLEVTLRTLQGGRTQDVPLQRLSVTNYAHLPDKDQAGTPQMVLVRRIAPYPVMTLWPVPDSDALQLVGWRMRRIQDAGNVGSQTMDIPFRFVPALVAGLAFFLSQKLKEGEARAVLLKQEYEETYNLAAMEDREKAPLRIVPGRR